MYEKLMNSINNGTKLSNEELEYLNTLDQSEYDALVNLYLDSVQAKEDEALKQVFIEEYTKLTSAYPITIAKLKPALRVLNDGTFSKNYHNKYKQELNELMVAIIRDETIDKAVRDEVLDRLMEKNIGLIGSILRRYSNKNDSKMTMQDLGQDARIALMRAIDKYNLYSENKFSTFAVTVLRNCIITKYTSKVNDMRSKEISFETPVADDGGAVKTLLDYQVDTSLNPEELVMKDASENIIYDVLNTLTMEQKFVAYCRFGLGGVPKKTQAEIAEYMHMSQANVSKIENNMLKAMKKGLAKAGLF